MAEAPFCEAHCMPYTSRGRGRSSHPIAGHTYCAVGALTFIGRLSKESKPVKLVSPDTREFESLIRWLVARQTSDLGEESDEEDTESAEKKPSRQQPEVSFDDRVRQLPNLQPCSEPPRWAGFNGRYNKTADTCYCFWNTGALAVCISLLLFLADSRR